MDENPVLAPASIFTAEREKEPETGYPLNIPDTIFDMPCPTNSWLASRRWRVRAAIALAIDIASIKPISEMTIADVIN